MAELARLGALRNLPQREPPRQCTCRPPNSRGNSRRRGVRLRSALGGAGCGPASAGTAKTTAINAAAVHWRRARRTESALRSTLPSWNKIHRMTSVSDVAVGFTPVFHASGSTWFITCSKVSSGNHDHDGQLARLRMPDDDPAEDGESAPPALVESELKEGDEAHAAAMGCARKRALGRPSTTRSCVAR